MKLHSGPRRLKRSRKEKRCLFTMVQRAGIPDGIMYASREFHYEVFQAARMLGWNVKVHTRIFGEIASGLTKMKQSNVSLLKGYKDTKIGKHLFNLPSLLEAWYH